MKKALLLLLMMPFASFGFQTEISGSFNSTELDPVSTVTGYQAAISYYYDDVYYDSKPFKEASFISRESSITVGLGASELDDGGQTTSASSFRVSGARYDGDFYLSGGIFTVKESSSPDDFEVRTYSVSPGLFFNKHSLMYLSYNYIDFLSTPITGTIVGVGVKTVQKKISLEVISSFITTDNGFGQDTASNGSIVYDYYLSNTTYIGYSYASFRGDLSDLDDTVTNSFRFGGLISRAFNFTFEYIENKPKYDLRETTVGVSLGYSF